MAARFTKETSKHLRDVYKLIGNLRDEFMTEIEPRYGELLDIYNSDEIDERKLKKLQARLNVLQSKQSLSAEEQTESEDLKELIANLKNNPKLSKIDKMKLKRKLDFMVSNAGLNVLSNISNYDLGANDVQQYHKILLNKDENYKKLYNDYLNTPSKKNKKEKLSALMSYVEQLKKEEKFSDDEKLTFSKMTVSRDRIIKGTMLLAASVARMFAPRAKAHVDFDDLLQAAYLGLIVAADKYIDTPYIGRPAKFSTFAYTWIKKYVKEEIRNQNSMYGGHIRDKEAAQYIYKIESHVNSENPNDVYDKVSTNDFSEIKVIEHELKSFERDSRLLFEPLTKKEKQMLFLAYGIDTPDDTIYSITEIANKMGVSKAKISRDIKNIMWKLTHMTRGNLKGRDLIANLLLLHGIDISKTEWAMPDVEYIKK